LIATARCEFFISSELGYFAWQPLNNNPILPSVALVAATMKLPVFIGKLLACLTALPVSTLASEHRTFCPFELHEWNGEGCSGSPASTTTLYADGTCTKDEKWYLSVEGPGQMYSAYCSDTNQFVFQTTGCVFECIPNFCTATDYSDPTLGQISDLGTCYYVTSTDNQTGVVKNVYSYVITGDCTCTNSPTFAPAPTGAPSAARIEFEFQGPGVVECTREEDECDLDEGPRCSNLNWILIKEEEELSNELRFGSEGIVKFKMTDEDCKATCTEGCEFSESSASRAASLLVAGLSIVITVIGVF
jgi:hypothetical protein